MTQNTSSRNFNIIALRGGAVTDMEYIETFGLDPALAGTPGLNDAMLNKAYQDNIASGMSEADAMKARMDADKDIKKLLASKGMLK